MPKFLLLQRALLILATLLLSAEAQASAKDYEFQALAVEIGTGPETELSVRLVHKASQEPIGGAVVFRTRLDMSPDGMGAMTAQTVAVVSNELGLYHFRADLDMAGRWALKLMAKVQGEPETVEATVVFTVK
ncbi:MAG: FixH family protein [Nitratireductor sp.]